MHFTPASPGVDDATFLPRSNLRLPSTHILAINMYEFVSLNAKVYLNIVLFESDYKVVSFTCVIGSVGCPRSR